MTNEKNGLDLPENVSAVKDRHGKVRYRFRKAGLRSRYLPGWPGDDEFASAYERCLDPDAPSDSVKKRVRRKPISSFKGRSVVYFIGAANGAIKIGTTVDLPDRIKKLQTGCPMGIKLLAVVDGGEELERQYHRQFREHQIRGEWFRGRAVRREVDRLKGGLFVQPSNP